MRITQIRVGRALVPLSACLAASSRLGCHCSAKARAATDTYDMVSWEPRSGKIGNIERRDRIVDADDYE